MPMVKRLCEICSKEFTHKSIASRPKFGRFCSVVCRRVWSASFSIEERFKRYVGEKEKNGCMIWKGATHEFGYGVIGRTGRGNGFMKAHRVSYEIVNGPIPEGMCVLHKCDNPPCVNPEHLFLGTDKDNKDDMFRKKRNIFGDRCPWSKVTSAQVIEIRERYKNGGITQESLGQEYGISSKTVNKIILRQRWKEV